MGDVAKGIKSFKKGMKDPVQDQESSTIESDSKSSEDIPNEDSNSDKK
jgi:Sec-independent protein translocase protein TatA